MEQQSLPLEIVVMQRKLNRSDITRSHGQLQSEYQKAMQGATPEQSSKFEIGVSLEKLERAAISISCQDNQILQGHFDQYNRHKTHRVLLICWSLPGQTWFLCILPNDEYICSIYLSHCPL